MNARGFVLEFFGEGPYLATGSYYLGTAMTIGRPLQWRFHARRAGLVLTLKGEYYALSGPLTREFTAELTFEPDEVGRGTFVLKSEFTGEVHGAFLDFSEGSAFSGYCVTEKGSVSIRLASASPKALLAQGLFVRAPKYSVAFSMNLFSGDPKAAAENVVGLPARKSP